MFIKFSFFPRLLFSLGSPSNGHNPMTMNYQITSEKVDIPLVDGNHELDPAHFNISYEYCHVATEDSPACSCQDCAKSCGAPPEPIVEPDPCLIMGK